MAGHQTVSQSPHRSPKRRRQPDVAPRRSARLKPPVQGVATVDLHPVHGRISANARRGCEPPGPNIRGREGTSLNGRRLSDEHHDVHPFKSRSLNYESAQQIPIHEDSDPIDYWRRSGFFWPKKDWTNDVMDRFLPQKKSSAALRRKRSSSELSTASSTGTPNTNTLSDQKSREEKSAPYRDPRYETILAANGSFMRSDPAGITDTSKMHCRTLLETPQTVPSDTLFRDDLFDEACEAIRNRNESRIIYDISQLLVPLAESLAIRGDKELRNLIQSVNEGWNNSIPITKTRPQPDYAVGFRREAFSEDQLRKIEPFVGDIFTELSLFVGTYYMYFPFFTCEVKCGAVALDVADRQNAHSMTIAVRGVVELFRLVGLEKELDRELLAFSISHDHRSVRIFGHYAVIKGKDTTYYRHTLRTFDFTELDGRDKWAAYTFTRNMYKIWMPIHLKRLCIAIDAISANLNFDVSQSELRFSEHSKLSQDVAGQRLSVSDVVTTESTTSSQLEHATALKESPNTDTQSSGQTKSKKPKKL